MLQRRTEVEAAVDQDARDPMQASVAPQSADADEDQGRAPGAAVEQPTGDPEVLPQPFHVDDRMVRRVDARVRCRIARVRPTSPATALVEENDPVALLIEEALTPGSGTRTRAAMHNQGGFPA
jgi:hypothetical protein